MEVSKMQLLDVLRLSTGLFLLPHLLLKIPRLTNLHEYYERARLPFPPVLACIGFIVEALVVTSLLFNVKSRYGAALGVMFLLVATYATVRINGTVKWRWDKGGPEYPLFLAVILAFVGIYSPN
jgi:uncharacterized membrane protein YphA (DoxX/SURF4 family)